MCIPRLVNVGNCRHDLSEEFSALCLTQSVSVYNVIEQLSPGAVFQNLTHHSRLGSHRKQPLTLTLKASTDTDHVNLCVRLQNLQQFTDVLVTQNLHGGDLQADPWQILS